MARTHLDILKAATDADGRKLSVHTLPCPLTGRSNVYSKNNPDFAPQFGDAAADKYCKDLLTKLYPGRVIVQVNIDPIAGGGGGIHCVTKNMPRL